MQTPLLPGGNAILVVIGSSLIEPVIIAH